MNVENQSLSIKFESRFGAENKINASQYIAEMLIEREAAKSKVKLPNSFWKNPEYKAWTQKFLKQKRKIDGLIRSGYSHQAIINTIRDKKNEWCYSLYNKKIEMAIHEENRRLSSVNKVEEQKQDNIPVLLSIKKENKTKSIHTSKINKLRD